MASDAPATKIHPCDLGCGRCFKTVAALQQHRLNAPMHLKEAGQIEPPPGTPGAAVGRIRGTGAGNTSELHGAQGATIKTLKTAIDNFVVSNNDAAKNAGGTLSKARAPQIAETLCCILCNRPFATDQELASYVRSSPSHIFVPVHGAATSSQEGLFSIASAAPRTALPTEPVESVSTPADTPVDAFFHSFGEFPYDRTKPPAESFRDLERHFGWRRQTQARKQAWARYQQALVDEVQLWYGDTNDITAWHELCRAVGIRDPPSTTAACTKLMRRTHVNIVDLIEWGRNGRPEDHPVTVYRTIAKLKKYTLGSGRIFPKEEAIREEDGATNIVLRHLLRDFRRIGLEGRTGEVVVESGVGLDEMEDIEEKR